MTGEKHRSFRGEKKKRQKEEFQTKKAKAQGAPSCPAKAAMWSNLSSMWKSGDKRPRLAISSSLFSTPHPHTYTTQLLKLALLLHRCRGVIFLPNIPTPFCFKWLPFCRRIRASLINLGGVGGSGAGFGVREGIFRTQWLDVITSLLFFTPFLSGSSPQESSRPPAFGMDSQTQRLDQAAPLPTDGR